MRIRILLSIFFAALVAVPAGILVADTPDSTTDVADPCGMLSDKRVVTCFTDPTTDETGMYDGIAGLVGKAQEGDKIDIMMYSWRKGDQPERIAEAVAAAHNRKVNVRVVIDEAHEDYKSIDILRAANVDIEVCKSDNCLMNDAPNQKNGQPMNHTKLLLFNIDGKKSLVAGSANLGASDYDGMWNDMVRLRDTRLHGYLSDWFDRVKDNNWKGWDTNDDRWGSGDSAPGEVDLREMAYLYPREKGDPITKSLERTEACHGDGDKDGDYDKRVWVAISKWTKYRTGILDELDRLGNKGCDVRVLLSEGIGKDWANTMRDRIGTNQVKRICGDNHLHHKMLILDAKYKGSYHEVVFTGSQIWTSGSLRNSTELNLRIGGDDYGTDDNAVGSYISHYHKLWTKFASPQCRS